MLAYADYRHRSKIFWDNIADFVSLIDFLLERGSNPNVLSSMGHSLKSRDGGTAMDMFASGLSFPPAVRFYGCPAGGALIRDKIAAAGGEFSHSLNTIKHIAPHYHCREFELELDELTLFPELFER